MRKCTIAFKRSENLIELVAGDVKTSTKGELQTAIRLLKAQDFDAELQVGSYRE